MTVKCINKESELTIGNLYEVIMLENQGSEYQIKNDSEKIKNYPAESFIVTHIIKAKCKEDLNIDLIKDNIYDVVSIDKERNECRVIDESGEDYIYDMDCFDFLDDK